MNKEIYSDHAVVSWVLEHCKVLRLGLAHEKYPYVVPVNFGYTEDKHGHYTFYVHGTDSGLKGELLDKEPTISFETDGGHENLTYTPPYPNAFGPSYRSIMGYGHVTKLTDNKEKLHALHTLIHHYVRDIPAVIRPEQLTHVPVWKIEVEQITAKIHHPTAEWHSL